jgi:hypothetical protein
MLVSRKSFTSHALFTTVCTSSTVHVLSRKRGFPATTEEESITADVMDEELAAGYADKVKTGSFTVLVLVEPVLAEPVERLLLAVILLVFFEEALEWRSLWWWFWR